MCACNHNNNKNLRKPQIYINIIDIRQNDTRQKYHYGINALRIQKKKRKHLQVASEAGKHTIKLGILN